MTVIAYYLFSKISKTYHTILALLFLWLVGHQIIAQNVIFFEDFELGTISSNWVVFDNDQLIPSQEGWQLGTNNSPWVARVRASEGNPNNYAASAISWFNPASCCANDWLISGPINLSQAQNVFMRWKFAIQQTQYPDGYRLLLSTTGNTIADFENGQVLFQVGSGCSGEEYWDCNCELDCTENFAVQWGDELINLSSYLGQTIYIAFHHDADDQYALYLDDIEIFEPYQYDIKLTQTYLPSPYAEIPISQVIPWDFSVQIQNVGSLPLTNVRLAVQIHNITQDIPLLDDQGSIGAIEYMNPSAVENIHNGLYYLPDQLGIYRVVYQLSADQLDQDEANNSDTLYYHINQEYLARDMVFLGDTLRQPQYLYEFPQNAQEGYLSYVFRVNNPTTFFGVAWQVGTTPDGQGYDPETPLIIELQNASQILESTDTLYNIDPALWQINQLDCVELSPGVDYYLSYHQLEPGNLGMVVVNSYFNSAAVTSVTNDGSFTPPGQPTIKAILGDPQPVTGLEIIAESNGLSYDFSFAFEDGRACYATWYFQDGTVLEGFNINYIFPEEGSYGVCLDVDGVSVCQQYDATCSIAITPAFISTSNILLNIENGVPPYTYEWSNGSSSNPATNLEPQTDYVVTVTDSTQCTTTQSFTTTACAMDVSIILGNNNGGLVIASGGLLPYNYEWFDGQGNLIYSGINNFLNNLTPGNYYVFVTDGEGCTGETSFLISSIHQLNTIADGILIYPNPVSDYLYLQCQDIDHKRLVLKIYDMNSKLCIDQSFFLDHQGLGSLDVSMLNSGIYVLKIITDHKVYSHKWIKR